MRPLQESQEVTSCPFCALDRPEPVTLGVDPLRVIFVRCPECGCIGPKAVIRQERRNLRYEPPH